jgi:threonine dehydratase
MTIYSARFAAEKEATCAHGKHVRASSIMIDRDAIASAASRISGRVRHTPLLRVSAEDFSIKLPVTLKLELLQHSGSFKSRGAFNRMLSAEVPAAGVIAASGGNHGAAVAYAARSLGVTAEIF